MKETSDRLSPNLGGLLAARTLLLCAKTHLLPWSICKNNLINNFPGREFTHSSYKEVTGMF